VESFRLIILSTCSVLALRWPRDGAALLWGALLRRRYSTSMRTMIDNARPPAPCLLPPMARRSRKARRRLTPDACGAENKRGNSRCPALAIDSCLLYLTINTEPGGGGLVKNCNSPIVRLFIPPPWASVMFRAMYRAFTSRTIVSVGGKLVLPGLTVLSTAVPPPSQRVQPVVLKSVWLVWVLLPGSVVE